MTSESELRAKAESLPCDPAQWAEHDCVVANEIVDAYLATLRDDDGAAIDEGWCRTVLGKSNVGRVYQCGKWIPEIRGIDQWVRLRDGTTRGEVRQLAPTIGLVAALGVNTEGGGK